MQKVRKWYANPFMLRTSLSVKKHGLIFNEKESDADIEVLAKADLQKFDFKKYLQHTDTCMCRAGCIEYMDQCDCGLDDFLKAWESTDGKG